MSSAQSFAGLASKTLRQTADASEQMPMTTLSKGLVSDHPICSFAWFKPEHFQSFLIAQSIFM